MKDAIQINNMEPDTNFFIANLLSAKGNLTGAMHHYKQSVQMKPDYAAALQFILVPACDMKFKSKDKQSTCDKKVEQKPENNHASECLNGLTPQKVEDKDSLILCKDGHCKSVTPEEFLVSFRLVKSMI